MLKLYDDIFCEKCMKTKNIISKMMMHHNNFKSVYSPEYVLLDFHQSMFCL